jgi:hypothetical protein
MDAIIVELLQKKLEEELNKVLKQLELQVDKVEFNCKESLALIINLKSVSL